jgi:hypothetical protein
VQLSPPRQTGNSRQCGGSMNCQMHRVSPHPLASGDAGFPDCALLPLMNSDTAVVSGNVNVQETPYVFTGFYKPIWNHSSAFVVYGAVEVQSMNC